MRTSEEIREICSANLNNVLDNWDARTIMLKQGARNEWGRGDFGLKWEIMTECEKFLFWKGYLEALQMVVKK